MPRNSTCYKIAGTSTLRLSSSKILSRWGSNLQNVEDSMRRIYVPDDGKIFVQVDQSGAEALIVAYLCRNGNFRKLFLNRIKIHCYIALHLYPEIWQEEMDKKGKDIKCDISKMLTCPIEELRENPFWSQVDKIIKSSDYWENNKRYYYFAKQTAHSADYDVKGYSLSMNTLEKSGGKVVIPKDEADRFLRIFHSLFPEIHDWHREVREQVESTGILYNLQGFPLEITGKNYTENFWKECYAVVPQSTVGTMTNIAFTKCQEFIETAALDYDLLANTHDSYLSQVPIGEEKEASKIMKGFMEQDLVSPRGEKFKMKSDASSGYNWGKHKPDNLEGMKEIEL